MKIKNSKFKVITMLITISAIITLNSCGGNDANQNDSVIENPSSAILDYLEENGNLINSAKVPALINADEVYQNLKSKNYLIIDLRIEESFKEAHIPTSVNVRPVNIIHYFENIIDPNSFEKIVLVCPNSFLSGYVNMTLMLLGYQNVYTLRYGLSSWNREAAHNYWLAGIGSYLEGKLDKTEYPKPALGSLPSLKTDQRSVYQALRHRAQEILDVSLKDVIVTTQEIIENPDKYFIISYWPKSTYDEGHLPGAIHYAPKQSLARNKDLLTLPTDKPIAVFCYTASHSSFVTAYLRLLGYNAFNQAYGANAFMNNTMIKTQTTFRGFQDIHINDFPLISGDENGEQAEVKTETITIQGGC